MSISARCKIAREARDLSQDDAAELLDTSVRNLRRYESINVDNLFMYQSMATVYSCSLDWLLLGIGPMFVDRRFLQVADAWNAMPPEVQQGLAMLVNKLTQTEEVE